MKNLNRRQLVQGLGASALSPLLAGHAMAQSSDIVIGAAQPITGVFAFAGVAMNNGLNDFVQWSNEAKGGVMGRKLRYISEDSGYKMDQAMAVFKKLMAAHKPPDFYGDPTADRKSTRLNSSHITISYAVFCLKKKNTIHNIQPLPPRVALYNKTLFVPTHKRTNNTTARL